MNSESSSWQSPQAQNGGDFDIGDNSVLLDCNVEKTVQEKEESKATTPGNAKLGERQSNEPNSAKTTTANHYPAGDHQKQSL